MITTKSQSSSDAALLSDGRIAIKLSGVQHVISASEAAALTSSLQCIAIAQAEAATPALARLMANIREQAQRQLDPASSTIREELALISENLREAKDDLADLDSYSMAEQLFVLARINLAVENAEKYLFRAQMIADGIRISRGG